MQFSEKLWKIGKNTDIEFVTKKRRIYLVSQPNYHTAKTFSENLGTTEMIRSQIIMNKPVYLGLSILELRKMVQ